MGCLKEEDRPCRQKFGKNHDFSDVSKAQTHLFMSVSKPIYFSLIVLIIYLKSLFYLDNIVEAFKFLENIPNERFPDEKDKKK